MSDKDPMNTKPSNHKLPKKKANIVSSYISYDLNLNPFGKIIQGYYYILLFSKRWWERFENVDSSFGKMTHIG